MTSNVTYFRYSPATARTRAISLPVQMFVRHLDVASTEFGLCVASESPQCRQFSRFLANRTEVVSLLLRTWGALLLTSTSGRCHHLPVVLNSDETKLNGKNCSSTLDPYKRSMKRRGGKLWEMIPHPCSASLTTKFPIPWTRLGEVYHLESLP